MRRTPLVLALALGSSVPAVARADDKWSLQARVDLRLTWIDHPPSLSQVNGTSLLPLTPSTGAADIVSLHGGVDLARAPLVFPLLGLDLGAGAGGYGGGAFSQDGPVWMMSLSLPGVGVGTSATSWRWMVAVTPAIDFLETSGHFVVNGANVTASGDGLAFALRSRAELCLRNGPKPPWVCVSGGPTLLQGERWLDGGWVGVGVAGDL